MRVCHYEWDSDLNDFYMQRRRFHEPVNLRNKLLERLCFPVTIRIPIYAMLLRCF